jgi:hypothetical protein
MNQPTDLRELLQSIRTYMMPGAVMPVPEQAKHIVEWIDAALAQPPDAKPVALTSEFVKKLAEESGLLRKFTSERPTIDELERILAQPDDAFEVNLNPDGSVSAIAKDSLLNFARMVLAYAAPQPPAGKEHSLEALQAARGVIAEHTLSAIANAKDAIPREIHERLVAEHEERAKWWQSVATTNHDRAEAVERALAGAKAQALREAAAACVAVHDERKKRSGADFGFNAIMECKEAIERMASEHERGG